MIIIEANIFIVLNLIVVSLWIIQHRLHRKEMKQELKKVQHLLDELEEEKNTFRASNVRFKKHLNRIEGKDELDQV